MAERRTFPAQDTITSELERRERLELEAMRRAEQLKVLHEHHHSSSAAARAVRRAPLLLPRAHVNPFHRLINSVNNSLTMSLTGDDTDDIIR